MPPQSQTKRSTNSFLVPGAIIVAGVFIAAGLYFGLSNQGGIGGAQGATPTVNIKDVKTDGDPYIGKADAPVVMAFWADFQCPYCKAVEVGHEQIPIDPAMPDLITKYVDTGKLKIVFKDYPFLGEDSTTGAEYARAVWELYPGEYFAFRTAMYEAQDNEGDQGFGDAVSIDALIRAKLPKIDGAKIQAAVVANKEKYDAALAADRDEGTNFGIQGTPAFIIGTTLIPGAAPLASFTDVIDAELK